MAIGSICNREVVTTGRKTPVVDVAKLMRGHHVGSIVIVDEDPEGRRPVGILTDRDLVVEVLAQEVPPEGVCSGDLMATNLLVVNEEDGVWQTIERMADRSVRRSPVVDSRGRLVGLITVDDLIDLLAGELSGLATLINREQRRERQLRRSR